MKKEVRQPASTPPVTHRFLPALLVLFFGSGCSALIYEIVWFQLLQLIIGSSAVSLAVLLGTFMGGMCVGSLLFSRVIATRQHPLRVYALLELSIGVVGIVVLAAMPYIGGLYAANVGRGLFGILFRAAVCSICLIPPTLLMGATLPAIARWTETSPKGVSWLGFFYSCNIAGAVFGCLLAGFYLLRVYDMATATYVAVAINVAVALAGLGLARGAPHVSTAGPVVEGLAEIVRGPWAVYVVIALSGLSALAAEVVWTRLLSLMLGASVYTFSIILAVFLLGLGIGSSVGAAVSRATLRAKIALGCCQMFLVLAIAWSGYMLNRALPYWPIDPSLSSSPWFTFQVDLVRCALTVLPAAFLWGASFPLALASVVARRHEPGRLVGGLYAANTIGGIVGALGFSLLVIPSFGTQFAQRLLIGFSGIAALLMFGSLTGSPRSHDLSRKEGPLLRGSARFALIAASVVLGAWAIASISTIPAGVVGYGRFMTTYSSLPKFLYVGEGMNSTIAVSELDSGVRNFHVSGKIEASSEELDMRLQLMLGNIPAMLHPKPRSVLVVGFGAGVTAGSFVPYPGVERIVVCEIEPLIPQVVSQYFTAQNQSVLSDPRVEVVYDDARHYILTTDEKFDIITSDPIHPWVKGAAALYTQEYFDLVKQHLNPGGLVTQWVPLYESNSSVVKSEVATFFNAFPHGAIWANENEGVGYDIVLLGQTEPARIDLDELEGRLSRPEYASVMRMLNAVGFTSAVDVLATYAGRPQDLRNWLNDAVINRDLDLRLQYLAGLGLNLHQSGLIYRDMLSYRRFPEELFVSSGSTEDLRKALERSK